MTSKFSSCSIFFDVFRVTERASNGIVNHGFPNIICITSGGIGESIAPDEANVIYITAARIMYVIL